MSRSRRIRKKLHRRWLGLVVDLSQHSKWRKTLFEAEPYQEFVAHAENVEVLYKFVQDAMLRYGLRYVVSKVPGCETEPWLSEGGMIVFKFRAEEFPTVKTYTGNNPAVV